MTKNETENQSLPFKLVLERDKCTSCGTCVDACPEFYELDDNSIAHVIGSERVGNNDEKEMEDMGCSLEGAESCPVLCIHLYEDGDELL